MRNTKAIDKVICRPCPQLTVDLVVLSASGTTAPSTQSKELLLLDGELSYPLHLLVNKLSVSRPIWIKQTWLSFCNCTSFNVGSNLKRRWKSVSSLRKLCRPARFELVFTKLSHPSDHSFKIGPISQIGGLLFANKSGSVEASVNLKNW